MLELRNIIKHFGPPQAAPLLIGISMAVPPGETTALLGASGSGKSTQLKIVAGIEQPDSGSVWFNGQDISLLPPEQRHFALMFQDFALFPHLNVQDNVAFGLIEKGLPKADARMQARAMLERFGLGNHALARTWTLSGGEQQRVALARALAKGAPLMLLDEPLVNLDYKLREELREELTQLFAAGQSTVVYATTEPAEALLLGGYTAVLDEGRLLQYGPTAEVFHAPNSLRVARAFSDPPMNLIPATATAQGVRLQGGTELAVALPQGVSAAAGLTVGVRASALREQARPGDVSVAGVVELAEISGSDTFMHAATPWGELVAQLTGVHYFELGAAITLHLDPAQIYVFGADGRLAWAPVRQGGV